jgi:peptidoglycan/xylan/chitin deacetylase (PgdA/CDA1 family)
MTEDMGALDLRPVGAALAVTAAATHAGPALCAHSAALRRALGVRDRLEDGNAVALTFDDGPHPQATPLTLELLRDAGATATFFLVGEQVRRHPLLARDIAAAGHEVAVHGDRHRNLLRLTPIQARADLLRAERTIAAVTGCAPRLYRPPYGVLTATALRSARSLGWETVLWSRWGRDWRKDATPASVAHQASAGLRGGEVLLLHDADHYGAAGCWRSMVGALPQILAAIRAAGLATAAVPHPPARTGGHTEQVSTT